jgi:hypothetical protein
MSKQFVLLITVSLDRKVMAIVKMSWRYNLSLLNLNFVFNLSKRQQKRTSLYISTSDNGPLSPGSSSKSLWLRDLNVGWGHDWERHYREQFCSASDRIGWDELMTIRAGAAPAWFVYSTIMEDKKKSW